MDSAVDPRFQHRFHDTLSSQVDQKVRCPQFFLGLEPVSREVKVRVRVVVRIFSRPHPSRCSRRKVDLVLNHVGSVYHRIRPSFYIVVR